MIITESNEVAVTPGRCIAWRCNEPTDSLACEKHVKEFGRRATHMPTSGMIDYLTDKERSQLDALPPNERTELLRGLRDRLYMRMRRAQQQPGGRQGYNALRDSRRRLILAKLHEHGRVITADLAVEFGITADAMARELVAMDRDGLCRKVYGGARLDRLPAPGLRSRA